MHKIRGAMCRLSVLFLLVAGLPAATVGLSAHAANADNCVTTTSGLWQGSYSGSASGSWHADFNFSATTAPDTASGTFTAPGVTAGPYTATMTCAGVFDLTANTPGGTVLYHSDSFDSADQFASGTWQYGSFAGAWSGSLVNYPTLVDEKGPLAYWRLGEGTNESVATDSSGNGRDGVYDACVGRGAPGAIAGDPDTAATFLANNCGVKFTPGSSDSYSGDFTAEAWVKPAADTDKPWYTFLSSRTADSSGETGEFSFDFKLLGHESGQKQLAADVGNGSNWLSTSGIPFDWQPGTWYDVALSVDSNNGVETFYVDGQSIGTLSFTPDTPLLFDAAHPMEIGQVSRYINNPPPTEWFDGTIDEVALYPQVVSGADLLTDYQVGAALPATPLVTGVSPNTGPAAGGTSVTVTGTGFTGASAVNFGGSPATSFTVNSDSSITATSPEEEGGTVDITVTTKGGTSPTGSADQFTFAGCTGVCASVGDVAAEETDTGMHVLSFAVTLAHPATALSTVKYAVVSGTATGGSGLHPPAGTDFKFASGTLTFKPAATTGMSPVAKSIPVTVFGDTNVEPNETFTVVLSSPTGQIQLARPVGTGTILNDDPNAAVTMGIGDASAAMQATGTQTLKVPVTLSQKVAVPIAVTYTVTPGTATNSAKASGGGDFGGKLTGKFTLARNAQVHDLSFPIWPHASAQSDKSFTITLTGATGAPVTIIRTTGTETLLGYGKPPSLGLLHPVRDAFDGTHLWITNYFASTVTEINPSDGSLVRTLSGGNYGFLGPTGITFDGTHLWVANSDNGNSLTEINPSDGSWVQTLSGGSYGFDDPYEIAFDGTHLWVTNEAGGAFGNSGGITELNASDGSWVRTLSGGSYGFRQPLGIAFDGTHLWAANQLGNSVTEINASDGSWVQTISGGSYGFATPQEPVFDGTHVWITNWLGGVTEINPSDGSWVQTLSGGNYGFNDPSNIGFIAGHLWVPNAGGPYSMTEINPSDGSWVRTLSGGSYGFNGPVGLAFDGSHIWVPNAFGNTVTEVNASDGSWVRTVS
jgi:hypothetical protein